MSVAAATAAVTVAGVQTAHADTTDVNQPTQVQKNTQQSEQDKYAAAQKQTAQELADLKTAQQQEEAKQAKTNADDEAALVAANAKKESELVEQHKSAQQQANTAVEQAKVDNNVTGLSDAKTQAENANQQATQQANQAQATADQAQQTANDAQKALDNQNQTIQKDQAVVDQAQANQTQAQTNVDNNTSVTDASQSQQKAQTDVDTAQKAVDNNPAPSQQTVTNAQNNVNQAQADVKTAQDKLDNQTQTIQKDQAVVDQAKVNQQQAQNDVNNNTSVTDATQAQQKAQTDVDNAQKAVDNNPAPSQQAVTDAQNNVNQAQQKANDATQKQATTQANQQSAQDTANKAQATVDQTPQQIQDPSAPKQVDGINTHDITSEANLPTTMPIPSDVNFSGKNTVEWGGQTVVVPDASSKQNYNLNVDRFGGKSFTIEDGPNYQKELESHYTDAYKQSADLKFTNNVLDRTQSTELSQYAALLINDVRRQRGLQALTVSEGSINIVALDGLVRNAIGAGTFETPHAGAFVAQNVGWEGITGKMIDAKTGIATLIFEMAYQDGADAGINNGGSWGHLANFLTTNNDNEPVQFGLGMNQLSDGTRSVYMDITNDNTKEYGADALGKPAGDAEIKNQIQQSETELAIWKTAVVTADGTITVPGHDDYQTSSTGKDGLKELIQSMEDSLQDQKNDLAHSVSQDKINAVFDNITTTFAQTKTTDYASANVPDPSKPHMIANPAYQKAVTALNQAQADLTTATQQAAQAQSDAKSANQQLQSAQSQLNEITNTFNQQTTAHNTAVAQLSATQDTLNQANTILTHVTQLQNALQTANDNLAKAQNQLATDSNTQALKQALADKQQALASATQQLDQAKSDFATQTTAFNQATADLNKAQATLDQANTDLAQAKDRQAKANQAQQVLDQAKAQLAKDADTQALQGAVMSATTDLQKTQADLVQAQADQAITRNQLKQADNDLKQALAKVAEVKVAYQKLIASDELALKDLKAKNADMVVVFKRNQSQKMAQLKAEHSKVYKNANIKRQAYLAEIKPAVVIVDPSTKESTTTQHKNDTVSNAKPMIEKRQTGKHITNTNNKHVQSQNATATKQVGKVLPIAKKINQQIKSVKLDNAQQINKVTQQSILPLPKVGSRVEKYSQRLDTTTNNATTLPNTGSSTNNTLSVIGMGLMAILSLGFYKKSRSKR